MSDYAIEFRSVNKTLGEKQILSLLDLKIEHNKFYSLIGESGSGKTTCLRLMNGLIKADSGHIFVQGKEINYNKVVNLRRKMGYAIQGSGLFPHLTCLENLSLIAKRKGWSDRKISKRAHEILEVVSLNPNEFLKKYPKQMSGGQQQRVGIARSLFLNPRIMLMDEPFGALDPYTRTEIQDFFLSLKKQYELTVVLVTHDISEALKMSDEIIVLNNGKVEQQGSPHEIVTQPKSDYIENYVSIVEKHAEMFQNIKLGNV